MKEYPKIESVFNRDPRTHKFVDGEWRLPEFEYLQDNEWAWTEKVDGTSIRVMWDGQGVRFGGRTDQAQIYVPLLDRLHQLFPAERLTEVFPPVEDGSANVCLYGEGYGAKIQKGGGNYKADGVDFVLFDVWISGWWLRQEDVRDLAKDLGVDSVPIIGVGRLTEAVDFVRRGFPSTWGNFPAEGLVCRPVVDLCTRSGHRIVTKIKTKDWQQQFLRPE